MLRATLCAVSLCAAFAVTSGAAGATPAREKNCGHITGGLWEEGLPNPGPNDKGRTYVVDTVKVPCSFARRWSATVSEQYSKCMQENLTHNGATTCGFMAAPPGFKCVHFATLPTQINPGGYCSNGTRAFSWALFHLQS